MLSNLLIYRFLIFNSLMVALVAVLAWNGLVAQLFENDQSRITLAIVALFIVGWLWSFKETAVVSLELNSAKMHGPRPALAAERDKDIGKVEWLFSVSEWLVALGLLGTVVGFYIALSGVDQNTVNEASGAQSAVAALMVGMRTALTTTILGAVLGLWHEVNVTMLRTALLAYWSDRLAAAGTLREARAWD
jgi:hypothetical protein